MPGERPRLRGKQGARRRRSGFLGNGVSRVSPVPLTQCASCLGARRAPPPLPLQPPPKPEARVPRGSRTPSVDVAQSLRGGAWTPGLDRRLRRELGGEVG